MRTRSRNLDGATAVRLVPSEESCHICAGKLAICETQERYVQTLTSLLHVISKGKKCSSVTHGLRYRSPEVGRMVLKGHEFGLDIVLWAGHQHLQEHVSIARIHRRLKEDFGVPICERSVGNLVNDYLALCQCVAGDSARLRERLKRQGGMVLGVDGVHFDEDSPVLYVQREAISGEVLYAERRLSRGKDELVVMLRRSAELATEIGVPILGITSDKERSLVPAIAEAFPGVPHQFCQTHYLTNVVKPLKQDDQALNGAAKETVLALRKVQRTVERGFPATTIDDQNVAAQPAAAGGVGVKGTSPTRAAGTVGLGDVTEAKVATVGRAPDGPTEAPEVARPVPGEAAWAEARTAAALALAGTTAGTVSGRPITDPVGLKRVQRLQLVRAAVERAARKKGAPSGGWPLLEELRKAFLPLDSVRPQANRAVRHLDIVRNVARILTTGRLRPVADAPHGEVVETRTSPSQTPSRSPAEALPPGAQVKRVLRGYLNRLEEQAPQRGRGAQTRHFIKHLVGVSNRYWPGLFHAYDHPEIPRTSNALEGFFGSSKRAMRSTTGCSSTSGGKMQSCGEVVIRVQALTRTMPKSEVDLLLGQVSDAAFAASKRQLRDLREPARQRRSFQRRPSRFLGRVLREWRSPTNSSRAP